MSNYQQYTNFTAKDSLPTGNEEKKVKGVDFDGEFSRISTAITSKADKTGTTFTGSVDLIDNARLRFGQDNDLQIWHNGGNSLIEDTGTGNLIIAGNAKLTLRRATSGVDSDVYIDCIGGGAVELYHDSVKKLETTSQGATVTGSLEVTGTLSPETLYMGNNKVITLGTVADFQMYHNGTDTVFADTGTGILKYTSTASGTAPAIFQIENTNNDLLSGAYIEFKDNLGFTPPRVGALAKNLLTYVDGNMKTSVTPAGLDVTGNVTATGVTTTDTLVVDKDASGILTDFKIAGATCGSVVASAGTFPSIAIGSGDVGFIFQTSSTADSIRPWDITGNQGRSGQIDLGANGAYWDDIYAINGTINTSDRNQKQSIEELTEAETRVAQTCKGLIRKFKWNSAVDKKGVDGARYHFGVIAQDLQAAFAAEGLDAGDYGLFVSSTWTDEDGVEQTSLGVRYTELLAFIIGGLV